MFWLARARRCCGCQISARLPCPPRTNRRWRSHVALSACWIRPSPTGLRQSGAPKRGEATSWFKEEVARVVQHAREQRIKIAKTPDDIDRAVKGEPHVVLSVEGASFLDDGIESLRQKVAAN